MGREIKGRKAFSSEEISVFCEQIALLLNSGIPIYDGVHMLYEEIEDKRTKKVLEELEEQVRNNVPLHEALEKVEVFPAYMIQMVRIGEYSGKLEDVMHFLSVYYERETNVKISIRNAVRSPLIVFAMASAIMLLMAWRILPLFKTMFLELNAEISQNAQTMMNIGLTLGTVIAVINCIIMALIIILLVIKNTPFGTRIMEGDNFCLDTLDLANQLTDDLDLLVICNPNNPTSTAIPVSQMEEILNLCKEKNIYCMVDETYVEFVKNVSNITSCSLVNSHDNLIILRGTSKFFAAPGLRLGYAVCGNKELVKLINKRKNPWTINTLAAISGEIMFSDNDYIRETRDLIDNERNYIYNILSSCKNIKVYTPSANFVLVKILKEGLTSDIIFDTAMKKGFMIRNCSSFEFLDNRFIRFCFMMPEDNRRLLEILLGLLD